MPVAWVAFDLNGTLLDARALAGPLGGGPEAEALVLGALEDTVVQAMADTMTGAFRPFPDLMRSALERRLAVAERSADPIEAVLEQARALPPHEDSRVALETLRDAGLRVAVLTNSARAGAEAALAAAGLDAALDAVVGADEARAYKPDPRVYAAGLDRFGVAPDRACLVAAHWWDVLGAQRAGLRSAWVARKEVVLLSSVPRPDVEAPDLLGAARAIVARLA